MGYWENRRNKQEIIKHCPICNSTKYNGYCKKCGYTLIKDNKNITLIKELKK